MDRELAETDWRVVPSGRSGIPVYRAGDLFLKRLPRGASALLEQELGNESRLLSWLSKTEILVPELSDCGDDYFITRKLAGQSLRQNFQRQHTETVVATLAEWFRRLHSYSAPAWAADRSIAAELAEAGQRSTTPEMTERLTGLRKTRPKARPATLTHGDPWPCNLFFEAGVGTGILDWGRGGWGPPERDLAILDRALAHHYGPAWATRFWQLYGEDRPDGLDWFLSLHSFF